MFIAICYGSHYSVGYVLQCAMMFIPKLAVFCSVVLLLFLSLLGWMYSAGCCGYHYYFRCILQFAVFFITMLDVYCSVCGCHYYI